MTSRILLATAAAAALALSGCASNDSMMKSSDDKMAMADTSSGNNDPSDAPIGDSTPTGEVQNADENAPMVGGAPMYSNRTIVENASQADNLTTLVAAVQAAELVDTLSAPGPYTVFAPVNSAFDKLPAGTVDTLLKPENKGDLQGVLTYHVVPGTYDAAAIMAQKGSNASTTFSTAQGGTLSVNALGDDVYVIDSKGNAARILQSDVYQSNGVVHVIDTVLLP